MISCLGVIFALKVMAAHYTSSSNRENVICIYVSSKFAYWIELIIIQLIAPNASFIGHLSGILVGLTFVIGLKLLNFVENIFLG